MIPPTITSPQITDSLTQANTASLGNGPAIAQVQTYLAHAQAQGILFANMVNEQQQVCITAHATTVQSVMRILAIQGGRSKKRAGPDYTGVLSTIAGNLADIDTKLQQQQSKLSQVSQQVNSQNSSLGIS